MVIGFVCVEYINKTDIDLKLIDKVLKDKQKVFETLLSL